MASPATILVVAGPAIPDLGSTLDRRTDAEVVPVSDAESLSEHLDGPGAVDCLVATQRLPEGTGLDLLRDVRETRPAVTLVLLATDGSERLASDAFAAGLADYVPIDAQDPDIDALTTRIGETVETTQDIEREHEQYETIVETVPEGVFVFDEEAAIVGGNLSGAEMLGFDSKESVLGLRIPDLVVDGVFHREVVEQYLDVLPELLSSDTDTEAATFEFRAFPDSDDVRTFEASIALRPYDEEYRGSIGIIRDITDQKRRREELEKYETIINAVPDPVYALDEHGLFTFVNEAMESLAGYEFEKAQEEGVFLGITEDDLQQSRRLIRELLSANSPRETVSFEMDLVTRAGRSIPVENHMALLPHEDGFQGTAGILRDVGDQQRRKRRLDVLDTVLRHNLRNDMNVITGYAELLSEQVSDPDLVTAADSIRSKAAELTHIGNEVRILQNVIEAWQHDENRSTVDAIPLVERVVERFRRSHPHATFRTDYPETLSLVADSTLQRALTDLVENAIEHNDSDEPTVEVTVERNCEPPQAAATDAAATGDWVAIRVADDGPGIPNAERQLVTGDEEITPLKHGSGLGLWVVSWITESFGGDVTIVDRGERGSTATRPEAGESDLRGTEVRIRLRQAAD